LLRPVSRFGDGWGLGSTPHGMEIFDNASNSILNIPVGSFGPSLAKPNSLTTTQLAVNTFETSKVKLFPNPTTGIININTQTPVDVIILDVTGKVVFVASNITKDKTIDLAGLQKGIYLAKISSDNTTTTEKIILN